MKIVFKVLKIYFIFLFFQICFECKRNYNHNKRELESTKVVIISQNKCKENQLPIVIHSAAQSTGKYFDRRQLTRNTWVSQAKDVGMRPLFVIGLPQDSQTQTDLEREAKQHKDIIQFGFIDNYYNLTLKALSILGWITKNCLTSDYVLKTDDDVLINIPLLDTMFKERGFGNGLTGKMLTTRSNRGFGHKWFMPSNIYKSDFYRFLYGFSYVMSKNSIKKMYKTFLNFSSPVLDIDDLFMTGVLARKSRVRIFDNNMFDYYCGSNVCLINEMISIHGCESVNQTLYMWNEWQRNKSKSCRNRNRSFDLDFFDFKFSVDFDSQK